MHHPEGDIWRQGTILCVWNTSAEGRVEEDSVSFNLRRKETAASERKQAITPSNPALTVCGIALCSFSVGSKYTSVTNTPNSEATQLWRGGGCEP